MYILIHLTYIYDIESIYIGRHTHTSVCVCERESVPEFLRRPDSTREVQGSCESSDPLILFSTPM